MTVNIADQFSNNYQDNRPQVILKVSLYVALLLHLLDHLLVIEWVCVSLHVYLSPLVTDIRTLFI